MVELNGDILIHKRDLRDLEFTEDTLKKKKKNLNVDVELFEKGIIENLEIVVA